jgi:hypothetical protein
MTWAKLDDRFDENPKVLSVPIEARLLYVCGLTYSARALSDGFIPAALLPRLVPDLRRPERRAAELVRAGLWEEAARPGWRIHDWEKYNPPAAVVKAERERARQRMADVRANQRGTFRRTDPARSGERSGEQEAEFGRTSAERSPPGSGSPVPALDLGTDSMAALNPYPAEEQPMEEANGQIEAELGDEFLDILDDDQLYLWRSILRVNGSFRGVVPGQFQRLRSTFGDERVTEGLRRLAASVPPGTVERPGAYLDRIVSEAS